MKEYSKRRQLILKGLVNTLNSGIDTPEKVIYLLVEIKKLRELIDKQLAALDLYRDWVVHAELDHKGTTNKLIGKFDAFVKDNKNLRSISSEFIKYMPDFFTLNNLKNGMKEFLAVNELPSKLTDDKNCWDQFRKILLEILFECTINPPDGKIEELYLDKAKNNKYRFAFRLRGRRGKSIVKSKIN